MSRFHSILLLLYFDFFVCLYFLPLPPTLWNKPILLVFLLLHSTSRLPLFSFSIQPSLFLPPSSWVIFLILLFLHLHLLFILLLFLCSSIFFIPSLCSFFSSFISSLYCSTSDIFLPFLSFSFPRNLLPLPGNCSPSLGIIILLIFVPQIQRLGFLVYTLEEELQP